MKKATNFLMRLSFGALIKRAFWRYGMAWVCVGVAFLVRYALHQELGERAPFTFFALGAIITAWYGGLRPGLTVLGAGAGLGLIFFMSPWGGVGRLGLIEITIIGNYLVPAAVAVILFEALHRAKDRAEAAAERAESGRRQLEQEVGERVRVEQRLRENEGRLRSSEARFRSVVESEMIGIGFWGKGWEVVDGNGALLRMLGYEREELRERRMTCLDWTAAEFRGRDRQNCAELIEGGFCAPYEKAILRKDGTLLPVLFGAARFDGSEEAGSFFIIDLSERKKVERRLATQYAVTYILAESKLFEEAIPKVIQALCENLGWDLGTFWLVDTLKEQIRCVEAWHPSGHDYSEFKACLGQYVFGPGEGLPGRVWFTGVATWVPNLSRDPKYPRILVALRSDLHSSIAFPVQGGGQVLGVIELFRRERSEPEDALVQMLPALGNQVGLFLERRRAEEALRRSEERFHMLAENAPDIIARFDREARHLYLSPAFEVVSGLARQNLIGKRMSDIGWDPALAAHWEEGIRRVFETSRDETIEFTFSGKEGLRYYQARLAPEYGADGGVQTVLAITRDVTDLKKAQEDFLAEHAFRETIERAIPAGLAAMDMEGRQTYVNQAFAQMVGWPVEELIGKKPPFVYWALEDEERIGAAYEATLRQEVPAGGFELRFRKKSEERFDALVLLAPLRDEEEKLCGWVASVSDITARKCAEQEIQNLNLDLERRVQERTAALQSANEQMEAFCYSVSHDLRGPLRAMQGFTSVLVEDYGPKLGGEGQDYAQRIGAAAQRMDALIGDLLEYTRLSRMMFKTKQVDVGAAVEDAFSKLEREIRASGAVVLLRAPFPVVLGNHTILEVVLANLIANAIKFVAPGTKPRVEISVEERGGMVLLVVRDNGIGIEKRYHERIFQVFERLHAAQNYPGTGIGLAIVRKGVERMGGRVGLESESGKGSCFWIELPKATVGPEGEM